LRFRYFLRALIIFERIFERRVQNVPGLLIPEQFFLCVLFLIDSYLKQSVT